MPEIKDEGPKLELLLGQKEICRRLIAGCDDVIAEYEAFRGENERVSGQLATLPSLTGEQVTKLSRSAFPRIQICLFLMHIFPFRKNNKRMIYRE